MTSRAATVLLVSQLIGGTGLAAGVTVGALLSQRTFGTELLAGLPNAAATAGTAVAAAIVGSLSQRWGRRIGLAFGYGAAAIGSLMAVVAIATANAPILLLALAAYGAGSAATMQARYAGADLAPPKRQAFAISVVLMTTSVGVLLGPALLPAAEAIAARSHLPVMAGPFMLAGGAYIVALIVITALPKVPRAHAPHTVEEPAHATGPGVRFGAVTICGAQAVMVAIMTMTPVHMRHNGFGLSATGLAISLHIASMYLPAPLSGYLVDRFGSRSVGQLAALVLAAAAGAAVAAPGHSLAGTVISLVLLGWGWSLGVVAGSTAVTDAATDQTRPRTQGRVDAAMSVAGALAGLLSGLVVGAVGFGWLALGAGVLAMAYWVTVIRPMRVWRSVLIAASFVVFGCSLYAHAWAEQDPPVAAGGYPSLVIGGSST
ncbi:MULTISPECIES: MFS transporter [unclassified Mycobacteroides]|uniref:MFS transporter n=1 Tax=unclassified Mycobacteroides TaxID=2618759 RepID=UPI00132B679F|nr:MULTISPECIES: MFS transporter [unclassified Mycobacteroides]MUM15618.1 exopolyphosphatase [Mycobacteroides sp. CBMA 326]MUM17413.1 exopolyphosphatase [Mycobacteroides sp. CBMA 326]